MRTQVEFEHWVPFPLEQVFRFFADPENLPRIMPPESGTKLVRVRLATPPEGTGLAGVGSEIATSFRIFPFLPFRATWVARITEFVWMDHFADLQVRGPFRYFHHRHRFRALERNGVAGTVVGDAIEYDPGFGVVGRLGDKVFIGPQLRRTFEYRQRRLPEVLGPRQNHGL